MNTGQFDQWADILKTLGHPLRLQIIKLLAEDDRCVLSLWSKLHLQQSVVSQHLAVLRKKGIVQCTRRGTRMNYSVKNKEIKEIIRLIESDKS